MKIGIGGIQVPLDEGKREFTVQFAEPGIVRGVAWTTEQRLVVARGEPAFAEVLTMFVEFTPGAPMRNRRFRVMVTGDTVNVPEGYELEFVGTATSARTGAVAHLYEVRELARARRGSA